MVLEATPGNRANAGPRNSAAPIEERICDAGKCRSEIHNSGPGGITLLQTFIFLGRERPLDFRSSAEIGLETAVRACGFNIHDEVSLSRSFTSIVKRGAFVGLRLSPDNSLMSRRHQFDLRKS